MLHAQLFQESAIALGMRAKIVPNHSMFTMIKAGKSGILGMDESILPDFVLFWDKDLYLARQLESMGIPLFNSSSTIAVCDDKCRTYQALADQDIATPATIIGPKIDSWSGVQDFLHYDKVADELGFPMIIKEAVGSFGSQVYLIADKQSMLAKVRELGATPYVFQEFIASSYGRDLRLQVVGDEVVAGMQRVSDHDFRANMGQGARAYPHQPSAAESTLAVRAAKAVGAHFAGVDILFGKQGEPILCEINSNAHILNLRQCTGVNAADPMMAHIKSQLRNA